MESITLITALILVVEVIRLIMAISSRIRNRKKRL